MLNFTWLPSWLDRGALINVHAPGCDVSGLRPDGAQVGRFSSWGTVVPKGFLVENAYFSSHIKVTQQYPNQRGNILIRVNPLGT